jgi:hypothetical protein
MTGRKPDLLWQQLEDHPDLIATRREWEQLLGANLTFASRYLKATGKIASTWVCGRNHPGCFRQVIQHAPDRIVAICPERRCDKVQVQRKALRLQRLELKRLVNDICVAIGLNGKEVEAFGGGAKIGDQPSTLRLGGRTFGVDDVVFYFARDAGAARLLPLIEKVRLRDPSAPVALLIPCDSGVDLVAREAAQRKGIRLLALDRIVRVDKDNQLVIDQEHLGAEGRLDPGVPGARISSPLEDRLDHRPVFRRSSRKHWEVRFGNADAFPLNDTVGARCVHVLLSNAGQDIHCLRLRDLTSKKGAAKLAVDGSRPRVEAEPAHGDAGLHVDAETDYEALRQYNERLKSIDRELDDAMADQDQARIDRLAEERAALLSEVARATDKNGKPRITDEAEKARKAVSANLNRILKTIERENEELAAHLRASVRRGGSQALRA